MGSKDSEIVLIFVLSTTIILILIALVLLFIVIHQKRLVAQEVRLHKMKNDFQQELLQATIAGQERERSRLAKDLHDGIGSLLTGLRLNLKYQQRQHQDKGEKMNFLNEACSTLEAGIAEVRQVSHDLLPVTLESFGLMQALEEWIEPLQVDPNFMINFKHNGTARRLLPTIELGLLRVIQELIQNTLVHAGATSITFAVTFNNDLVEVNYSDNGKGFDPDLLQPGLGIKNMQSRILALGGVIQFNPVQTAGFSAHFNVPTNN